MYYSAAQTHLWLHGRRKNIAVKLVFNSFKGFKFTLFILWRVLRTNRCHGFPFHTFALLNYGVVLTLNTALSPSFTSSSSPNLFLSKLLPPYHLSSPLSSLFSAPPSHVTSSLRFAWGFTGLPSTLTHSLIHSAIPQTRLPDLHSTSNGRNGSCSENKTKTIVVLGLTCYV